MKKTSMFITGLLLSAMAFAQPAHTPSGVGTSTDITTGEFATMNPQHPKANAQVYLANVNFEFDVKDDPSINFDQVWQSIPGEGYAIDKHVNNPGIEDPSDFSGKFKLMYNQEGLIILSQVNDDDILFTETLQIMWSPYVNITSEFKSIIGNSAQEKEWRNWTYARYSTMGAWLARFNKNGFDGAINFKGDGTVNWGDKPAGWDTNILTFYEQTGNTIKQIVLLPWADCFNGADLGYTFDAAHFEQMVEALSFDVKFCDDDSEDPILSKSPDIYFWNSTAQNGYWSNYYSGYAKAPHGTLNLSTDHLQFSALSSSKTFSLSWTHNWKVESNQLWLTVDKPTGEDDATITVTAAPNTTSSSRIAYITVMGQGAFPKTIMVTQSVGQASLSVSKTSLNIDAANNSTASFIVTSNVSWIANKDQTWLTLDNTSGTGDATILATASENTSTTPRTATITLMGTGVSTKLVTVTQAGAYTGLELPNAEVSIYPIQDILVISILQPLSETNYTIHSVEGKLLMKSDILSDKTEIDMSNLSAGVYIVKIYSQNKVVCTKKIVKQ